MTISTTSSQIVSVGNGSQTVFQFPFVGVSSSDISVSTISPNGSVASLSPSQYTISLNSPATNQLWGVGGNVTVTSAPSTGTSLLIQRTLPYTQSTSVQNQGNYYAQVTEQALDTLCMEIQQISARTTQFRGIWTTATAYNFGDIVQDGINGAATNNYYICQNANTSGVWATDLANGDWAISVLAVVPSVNQPITLSGAISGSGTASIITGINANQVTNTSIASGAVTFSKIANIGPNTVVCNPSASSAGLSIIALTTSTLLGMGSSGNIADISLGSNLTMSGTVLVGTSSNIMTALAVGSIINAENTSGASTGAGTTIAAANLTPVRGVVAGGWENSGDTITGTWLSLQGISNSRVGTYQRTA